MGLLSRADELVRLVVPSGLAPERVLQHWLAAGGDERIRIDPATGANRYGTRMRPEPDAIWLSSSTATSIGPAGFAAARAALDALSRRGGSALAPWFDRLREAIRHSFGGPGTEVVLTPSGTDAELVALALGKALMPGPLVNVVIAPGETGSGVLRAAGGKHFQATTASGDAVEPGRPLEGWEGATIEVETVEIRDAAGRPRSAVAIDDEASARVEAALKRGGNAVLHLLDASKTGLSGVTRARARALRALAPERVLVVVDACQLRCASEDLRVDLDDGFLVLVTGSKFLCGPAFSGALLIPESLADRLTEAGPAPVGLAAYSAAFDWPERLRSWFAPEARVLANLGLGLRWEAALAEWRAFTAIPEPLLRTILATVAAEVRRHVAEMPGLRLLDAVEAMPATRPHSIIPIVPVRADGWPITLAEATALHRALREPFATGRGPGLDRACHLGQPVAVGPEVALRIAVGAPSVAAIGCHVAAGLAVEDAIRALGDDIALALGKLGALRALHCT